METWAKVLKDLEMQTTATSFNTHVAATTASTDEDTLTVYAAKHSLEWLQGPLKRMIVNTIKQNAPGIKHVHFRPQEEKPPETRPQPNADEITVNLVHFDPTQRGFVMTSNYAVRFWQPYLKALPFALWNTLRSFASNGTAPDTVFPSIQTLADICANGNRSRILGRAACNGRRPQRGAIQVLKEANIVKVQEYGKGRRKRYNFDIIATLPLLTPLQLRKLSKNLQEAHARFLAQCAIASQEWDQIHLRSLVPRM